ncbi:HPr kinase/phosphorylase [Phenylobacterium sp.]|uniref:HPr kinase/phosphorylase n=1 Tax=Phenylobacterium sp. TaxID=1871053 RepID=UPI002600E537|nr:HPr kinase/phosphorylase [Phenylobacterium sp.]
MTATLHAGLIALHTRSGWRGALIQGASGAGKSDLALRCLEAGFRLVADDRTMVWASGDALYGRAPGPLAGLVEVRGLGVLPHPALAFCRIVLSVRDGTPERLPDPAFGAYEGLSLPEIVLPLLESAAPAKLRRALQHLGAGAEGAYQSARVAAEPPRPGGDTP